VTQTKTAMYDTRGAAETARDGLIALGIASTDISIRGTDEGDLTSTTDTTENKGFWASLADVFMPDDDRYTYEEGVRRGGYLLTARVPDGLSTEAEDVLESADPVDIDERSAGWRQEGWTTGGTTVGGGSYAAAGGATGVGLSEGTAGYGSSLDRTTTASTGTMGSTLASDTNRAGYESGATTGTGAMTDAGTAGTIGSGTTGTIGTGTFGATGTGRLGTDDETLQVVEEDLKIGKRETGGGRVRVRTYVTERPVEEDVNLRSERVTIERRPVDRDVTPGANAFQERTIEAVERGEEAVVSKTARVKEEIALHKDVENRTETVRDTVRSTEVEVDDGRTTGGLASDRDPKLRRDKI